MLTTKDFTQDDGSLSGGPAVKVDDGNFICLVQQTKVYSCNHVTESALTVLDPLEVLFTALQCTGQISNAFFIISLFK